jgi:cell division protein FtsI/penicillin-binding protein 2
MRLFFVSGLLLLVFFIIAGRLFQLQVMEYRAYELLATDQHEVQAKLVPKRGTIYLKDRFDGSLHPIATDRDTWQVFAIPKQIKNVTSTAQAVADATGLVYDDLVRTFSNVTGTYTIVSRDVDMDKAQALHQQNLPGIGVLDGPARFYPEQGLGGQVFGFVTTDENGQRIGRYGIESSMNDTLAGQYGSILADTDAQGRRITVGTTDLKEAKDGSDLVLTIDRTIQFEACQDVADAVKQFQADSGSVVVMDPHTGAIMAMCAAPDFDPANFGKIDSISVLNNPPTFDQFEPGSIFKALTLASGIDAGKVTPDTTYEDKGEEKIDNFTIHNSDHQAHGVQTMTQVLDKSLNTGTIFVERQLGHDLFRDYVQKFGLGVKTGIELHPEGAGDLSPLDRKGEVFGATASYGQGITVTGLQMIDAYSAIANGGRLMKPYLIADTIAPDGTHTPTKPTEIRQVVSDRAARLVTGMLVTVVEVGHGKHAGVPGYYVAGKTGTAQVADPNGHGYLPDVTIGSFAGYAPSDDPKFSMIVTINHPRTVSFAESSAAPTWGKIAKFLLQYLQVQPERPITVPNTPDLPPEPTSTMPEVSSSTKP